MRVQSTAVLVSLAFAFVAFGCGGRSHPEHDAATDGGAGDADAGGCGSCDDGVECTQDSCVAGTCAHDPDDSVCAIAYPCRVADCDPRDGCAGEALPDGTLCGRPGADGAPPPVCSAGECVPQRVVGVESWATMEIETPELGSADGHYTHLARVTDRDGDGVDDVAVYFGVNGERQEQPGGVWLYSFPSGRTIWSLEPDPDELVDFGNHLASPGDVDGDGASDLVFRFERNGEGRVRAVDGNDGQTLWEVAVLADWLGVVDDLDGDGTNDLAVTEPYQPQPGALALISARTGREIVRRVGEAGVVARFLSPEPIGDGDGDGVSDLAVALAAADGRSSWLEMLSGRTVATITTYQTTSRWVFPRFRLGDLTGDGLTELIVTEQFADETGRDSAMDLTTGAILWVLAERGSSGPWAHAGTYDLDGDALPDFTSMRSPPWPDRHWVMTWHSASSGDLLFAGPDTDESGAPFDLQGYADLQVPDVNGDGAEDWLIASDDDKGRLLTLATVLEAGS